LNILLTGGSGFVGRYIYKNLIKDGHSVFTFSRKKKLKDPTSDFILGDLNRLNKIKQKIVNFNPEIIIHLAWQDIPNYSEKISKLNLKTSIEFFDFLFEETNCRKILCSGSCWEYGKIYGSCKETEKEKINTYFTWAKHSLNNYLKVKCEEDDIILNWFRFFYVYGPGQNEQSLIPSITKSILSNEIPKINTPLNKNDFIYVEDIAEIITKAVYNDIESGIYNLGNGTSTSVYEICKIIEKELLNSKSISDSVLKNTVKKKNVNFWADMQKINDSLTGIHFTSINKGIEKYLNYIKLDLQ
jgi:nucleoside-diphosphate-sugar epimerase